MPSIDAAFTWAVNCCNLPNVGYSQSYRNQQTVNGITYYDCSSFINYALLAGGWTTPSYAPNYNALTTGTMYSELPRLGFINVTATGVIKPGDIGLSSTHTEMCYQGGNGSGIFMGAHGQNGILLPNQVSIGSSSGDPTYRRTFPTIWRYGDGASGEVGYNWIVGDNYEYFPDYGDKQINNAACLYSYFYFKGWTIQAIAGLCGNIQQESTFNPACIEQGGTGHGLVQWTPPENLYDVLVILFGNHNDWTDGTKQCDVIYAEFQQSTGEKDWGIEGQWYPTSAYPMDWKTWSQSTSDPGELALAFQANYERPAALHQERAEYARRWLEILKNIDPKYPGYNTREPEKHKMPLWMKINYRL